MKLLIEKVAFKSQWKNALALYLIGVLSLAVVAYGCKALLNLI
jgi:hypothetical protein|tara:strand:- start:162 stop:290 length:129 start_codon:yes stop_codon:yes gene_type:complete